MPHAHLPLPRDVALFATRTAAWALLFGGWLVLGALGMRHAPPALGLLAPLALWLLVLGGAARVFAAWSPGCAALRATVIAAASLAALALGAPASVSSNWAWALAAPAWAVLLVAASHVVRGWRRRPGPRAATPVAPAALGALLAWCLTGDPLAAIAAPAGVALALLVPAAALAALVPAPADGPRPMACRSGLFDCSLAWPTLAQWRRVPDWPLLAASLAMLPMMVALPLMIEGCTRAGWPPHAATGVHLLAMLAPALVLSAASQCPAASTLRAAVAGLLVAGAVAAVVWPGVTGLMTAMALQSAAWGLGWSAALHPRPTTPTAYPCAPPRGGPVSSALAAAAAVTALGTLFADAGLAAWTALPVTLGVLAVAGLAAGAWRAIPFPVKGAAR